MSAKILTFPKSRQVRSKAQQRLIGEAWREYARDKLPAAERWRRSLMAADVAQEIIGRRRAP